MTTYDYDNVSRLTQIVQNLNGTTNDLTLDFTLNPAGQIATNTRSNTGYSFTGHANGSLATPADRLNRLDEIGGVETAHDARGNLTNDTVREFVYSAENRLRADSAGASQAYDPLGRLYFTYHLFADPPSSGTYLVSEGDRFVAELDVSTAVLRRYVFGPGIDEPLVWYEGSGLSGRRWLHADERGSVIAVSDSSGDLVGTRNRYDEYGNVQGSLTGRFGYTGQPFVPEFGLYYYRARIYNPALGRFMQTDPIGYGAGMNLYAYVGNDPANATDPMGLSHAGLTGTRILYKPINYISGVCGSCSGSIFGIGAGAGDPGRGSSVDIYRVSEWSSADKSLMRSWLEARGTGNLLWLSLSTASDAPEPTCPRHLTRTTCAILRDADVRTAMITAWAWSNPHGPRSLKNEHGFWIIQRGSDFIADTIYSGNGPSVPNIMRLRPPGAWIWFHTHPFTRAEGFLPQLHGQDYSLIRQNRIMMIAMTHEGLDDFDFRR